MSSPDIHSTTTPSSRMTVVVDFEQPHQTRRTEEIQREAFGRGDEMMMLRRARHHDEVTSLVAMVSGIVFGNTIYYPSSNIESLGEYPVKLGGLGPVAVDPSQQGRGIGKRLVQEALLEAQKDGFDALLADGLNGFWRKLGFRDARKYNLHFARAGEGSSFGVYWLSNPYHSSTRVIVDYPDFFQFRH